MDGFRVPNRHREAWSCVNFPDLERGVKAATSWWKRRVWTTTPPYKNAWSFPSTKNPINQQSSCPKKMRHAVFQVVYFFLICQENSTFISTSKTTKIAKDSLKLRKKKEKKPMWMFSSNDLLFWGCRESLLPKISLPFDSSSNIHKNPHLNRCLATFQRCGGGKPQVGISFHSNLDKLGHPNDRTTKTRFWWMVCEKLTIFYVVFWVGNKSSSNFGVFLSTFFLCWLLPTS